MAEHFRLPPDRLRANLEAVHRLDRPARERALAFVQRIADIISHMLEDRAVLHARLQAIASLTEL